MKFADKGHNIRHVFDDVIRHAQVEFTIRKRIWYLAQIMNNVGGGARIII